MLSLALLAVLLFLIFTSLLYRPHWWHRAYIQMKILSALTSYYTVYRAPSYESIVRAREELNKIPSHIALIFNENYYRSASLAELLNWCSLLEIDTVTLYSQYGVEETVIGKIMQELGTFRGPITRVQNKITFGTRPDLEGVALKSSQAKDRQNKSLEIIFLDRTFGKPSIAKLATNYLNNSKRGELSVEEFQKDVIQESEFEPPELAIIFGPAFSTCGYPPWHLQFTEMYHFHSHKYVQWRQILDVLNSFAKTKQNYGK